MESKSCSCLAPNQPVKPFATAQESMYTHISDDVSTQVKKKKNITCSSAHWEDFFYHCPKGKQGCSVAAIHLCLAPKYDYKLSVNLT